MSWRARIAVVWVLALALHHVGVPARVREPDPEMRRLRIESGARPVDVAWLDDRADRDQVLLLVHGSPGNARNFDQLRAAMPERFRLIVPDLPGFGSSTRELDDYSFTRHARDLLALLDGLGVERVHAVGMSMGGGVVLEMARIQPERIASLTLLSSIGLQEYELTGDYWTNHLVHAAQAGLVWVVDHLVPHFGLLDSGGQAWSYARNFLDSDQRRLEATIRRWDGPVLLIHGARDFLVPVEAARAHAGAMPQAVLREYADASHFMIWTQPEDVARDIIEFVDAAADDVPSFAEEPRPLPPPGPLAGPGRWLALGLAGLAAALAFPLAGWWFLPLDPRTGGVLLVVTLVAGAGLGSWFRARRRRARPGVQWLVMAGLYLAALAGWGTMVPLRSGKGLAGAMAIWVLVWLAVRARDRRGRARLRGQWLRWRRWEYWPGWAIYLPMVPRLCWRARRSGGLRTATCVNPAIALGGLVGESKSEILGRLAARPEVARWVLVPPGSLADRHEQVRRFAQTLERRWPVVLKPDRGERGTGVCIARTDEQVDAALRSIAIPVVVQEYVPGLEYGVFWWRGPADRRGTVFSVTHKAMVTVTGDGQSSLEELLCAHDRVLPFLDLHRERFAGRLHEIPAAGDEIRVTELGTHALGATFLDARQLASDALAAALDRIMDGSGLDFGRFDLRVASEDDLVAGRGLKVLEFNGVSAEAVHIYDPDHALATARNTLLDQWSAAITIGDAHRRAGARRSSWWAIARALRRHSADRAIRGGSLRSGG